MVRRMLILYGSETGCAKETSERIMRESRSLHFVPFLSAMDDYDRTLLPTEELIIFVCSVTGQGDPPSNMKVVLLIQKFWRFLLRKDIPQGALSKLKFGVFGQGDSSYPKYQRLTRFNTPAKKLYKRLIQLSAVPILDRGDGDDQHDLGCFI
jgi:sulfite reductase alpha subunit-like flavoprotein